MNNKSIINMMTCHTKRLFLLFVLGITYAVSTLAAQWHTENGLRFLIDTKNITATVFRNTSTYKGDIVIPEKVTINNIDYPVVALSDSCFYRSEITSIIIPNSVKKLGISCFHNTNLTSIKLPDEIQELPRNCFLWNRQLREITLPQKLQKIGRSSLAGCGFTKILLPSSVTEISESAFSGSTLNSIELPDGIKEIGSSCFFNCSSLSEIKLPNSLESIGSSCFEFTSIKSITIPNTVTKMGPYSFSNCKSLTEVTIPSSLTYISYNAFAGCINLVTININSNVTSIEKEAFKDCNSITKINCYATEPPTLGKDVFSSGILAGCILNVPEEAEAKYKEAGASTTGSSAWKDFKNIYTLDTPEPGVDVLTASITDTEPNIPEGTYYAGNLTYTREGDNVAPGKYASLCLPFDINLAETDCFSSVFIPINMALYNTNTKLLTMMLDKADMTTVIKAGQPFLAKLSSDKIELKNCNSTYISDNYAEQELETAFKIYDTTGESGVLQQNQDLEVKFGGSYKERKLDKTVYRTFGSDGRLYNGDIITPFRAYLYKANAAAQAAVQSISWGVGDETTGIKYIVTPESKPTNNKVFTLDGKLVNQTGDTKSLKKGIYIINGRKFIIK